jgi:hypothetical protein
LKSFATQKEMRFSCLQFIAERRFLVAPQPLFVGGPYNRDIRCADPCWA